jgi:predicted nuclease of predicted toxin-antitoxin system
VKFKVDENLPLEIANLLQAVQYDVVTVVDQGLKGAIDSLIADVCLHEGRVLVTLDLDFADVRTYPPQEFPGFLVFRVARQDKLHLIEVFRRVMPLIEQEPLEHHLWIVEENRVRIRGA